MSWARRCLYETALLEQMAEQGNPASVTDAGVGALAIRTAVEGAGLNVKINASSIADADKRAAICARVDELNAQTADAVAKIMEIVNSKI